MAWEGDWDFYEGTMEDERAFITIDLAAAQHAPLQSHPARLQIRFAMLHPRADGLRDSEEAEAIFAVEDKLVAAMERAADGIHVARVTGQGFTELVFYVSAEKREAADNPRAAIGDVAPYQLDWFVEDDPEWEKYDELYPNLYAMQSISNRRLVRHMEEGGDQIAVAREIDHVAMFPSEEQARAAAEKLVEHGFRIDEPQAVERGWSLEFHREDACDGSKPDEFVFEILDLIEPFEGDFDGWGSLLVPG